MAVDDGADAGTLADEARRVVTTSTYLTLATADGDGRPWATPVWFAARGLDDVVWVSRPGARHSRNIAVNPAVGIAIFDSGVPVGGEVRALYAEAVAEEVATADRADVLAVYDARAREQGIGPWTEDKVTGAAQFRLYRARVSRLYVLDEHDGRVEVPRDSLP